MALIDSRASGGIYSWESVLQSGDGWDADESASSTEVRTGDLLADPRLKLRPRPFEIKGYLSDSFSLSSVGMGNRSFTYNLRCYSGTRERQCLGDF